jgi:hypothetical protein
MRRTNMGTFLVLACAAYIAGFLSSNLVSIVLVQTFEPPGHGRLVIQAALFRIIWSWSSECPMGQIQVLVALMITGCCLALFSTVVLAGLAACAASSIVAATLLTVVSFR